VRQNGFVAQKAAAFGRFYWVQRMYAMLSSDRCNAFYALSPWEDGNVCKDGKN